MQSILDGVPHLFYWGVAGSLGVEIGAAVKVSADMHGACPPLYRKPFYLGARFLLALIAGGLAVGLDAQNALTAFYLGSSAPLILDRFARGVQKPMSD